MSYHSLTNEILLVDEFHMIGAERGNMENRFENQPHDPQPFKEKPYLRLYQSRTAEFLQDDDSQSVSTDIEIAEFFQFGLFFRRGAK